MRLEVDDWRRVMCHRKVDMPKGILTIDYQPLINDHQLLITNYESLISTKEGKQPRHPFLGHRRAILAPLERFGILDALATFCAIARGQQIAEAVGVAAQAGVQGLAQPGAMLLRRGGHLVEVAADIGQPFVDLRCMGVQQIDLLLDHVVDRHHDIGREGVGLLEMVADIDDRRVIDQVWAGGADVRHHDHVGGVLDELGSVAVVGVVVVGARRHDQVGLERADQGDQLAPVL
nr:putative glycosyl transferase [uncultured bacterium]